MQLAMVFANPPAGPAMLLSKESVMATKKSRTREPAKRRPMRAESPHVKPKQKGELPPEEAAAQELPERESTREREHE